MYLDIYSILTLSVDWFTHLFICLLGMLVITTRPMSDPCSSFCKPLVVIVPAARRSFLRLLASLVSSVCSATLQAFLGNPKPNPKPETLNPNGCQVRDSLLERSGAMWRQYRSRNRYY